MVRSLAVLGVVGGLLIGCVTINLPPGQTPSGSPSATATAGPTAAAVTPTPSPSALPTVAPTPTVSPTAQPTVAATSSAVPSASAGASPSGVVSYGASTPLFNDGMDDPNSGWGTGTNDGGGVNYDSHAQTLEITVTGNGAWEWTRRMTGSTSNAVNAESLWTKTGAGMVGLLCASSDDELWGATEDAAGNYAFIKAGSNGATTLSQGHLDELKSAADGSSRFALDCAGTATGAFRMQLHPPGTNVGVQYMGAAGEGPATFDRIGIYAQSAGDAYSASVDFVLAFGGTGDTSMSADAVALMKHIPVIWQPDCFESFASVFLVGAKGDILCQPKGTKSDYAEYTSFATQADMDSSFEYLVNKWAVPETGQGCDTGAHLGTYSIGGQQAGRILCAPAQTGTQFVWTTNDLLIMSSLIDLEGSYPDMYADWLNAGPY